MQPHARAERRAQLAGPLRPAPEPERGARIGFFSGGTALRPLCAAIKRATHRTFHLVTPFDSGGSSGRLRAAFGMLSVGDLRSRLVALADDDAPGAAAFVQTFHHRLPQDQGQAELRARVAALATGNDPLLLALDDPLRAATSAGIGALHQRLPYEFDLRGACVGNLALAGSYLANGRDIRAVAQRFSTLARVRGIVLPIANADLQIAATLADGTRVVGQHRLTGKEAPPLRCAIDRIELVNGESGERAPCAADPEVLRAVETADLLCYPMGSFFTSVVANLLPAGIGRAVVAAPCPKVYVPNLGVDPEQHGQPTHRCVETLLRTVRTDAGDGDPGSALDFVLVDRSRGRYAAEIDVPRIQALGVEVIDRPLVSETSQPWIDPTLLLETLLRLC